MNERNQNKEREKERDRDSEEDELKKRQNDVYNRQKKQKKLIEVG